MVNDKELSLINVIKRKQVADCINVISKYDFVKRLIIFGSSVTDRCDTNSDIDICIDMIGNTRGLHTYQLGVELNKVCENNCDILTYNKLRGKIKNEIDDKGVIVYELS